jgi:hypothetical protein
MIKKIKEWLGIGTNWKSLFIQNQELILANVESINSFKFLRSDEIINYSKPLMFLHEASMYAGCFVIIFKNDDHVISGECVGFGTLINNVVGRCKNETGLISNIKKFYVVKNNFEEKIITIEEGMTVEMLKNK